MNSRPPGSICWRIWTAVLLGVIRRRQKNKRNGYGRKKKKNWSRHGRKLRKPR
jgi:hypothetical protein